MSIKGEDYVRIRVGWILERRKTGGKKWREEQSERIGERERVGNKREE